MSDSLRPHRRQPTRLPCPWDSPGKNTGVGCHFLLQCMKVKSLSRVRFLVTPWTAAYQAPPSIVLKKWETTFLQMKVTNLIPLLSNLTHHINKWSSQLSNTVKNSLRWLSELQTLNFMSRTYFSLSVEQGILIVVPDWTSPSDGFGFVNCKLNWTCEEGKHHITD